METLEIHSKSFLIKWVDAPANSTISWQVKPSKKSINFGLFRHSGSPGEVIGDATNTSGARRSVSSASGQTLEEKLHSSGLEQVTWHGRCDPDKLLNGSYYVKDKGAMYALVFDNTFSKNTAKTVLFSQHIAKSPEIPVLTKSISFAGAATAGAATSTTSSTPGNSRRGSTTFVSSDRYMTGVMLKKRRKKLQGYGRRYFSLDKKYMLLNYYLDQKSSLLRGSMPITLCVITAIEQAREIVIDSGGEVWNLKTLSPVDWKAWIGELDKSSSQTYSSSRFSVEPVYSPLSPRISSSKIDVHAWNDVSDLVERLNFTTIQAKTYLATLEESVVGHPDRPDLQRKQSFWKRRKSKTQIAAPSVPPVPSGNNGELDAGAAAVGAAAVGAAGAAAVGAAGAVAAPKAGPFSPSSSDPSLPFDHFQNCHDVMDRLSGLVGEFENLLARRKEAESLSRHASFNKRGSAEVGSIISDDQFYDAPEKFDVEGVLYVDYDSDRNESTEYFDDDDDTTSESDLDNNRMRRSLAIARPFKDLAEKDLYPLPLNAVNRRTDIQEATTTPPSLIGLLRKNVGKDLTTVAMPVACNEPITILERLAELVEYSTLLDQAVRAGTDCERALLVATFAVSYISSQRSKERALRKPFNPLLGETFELVREDRGFRYIAEKVSHRPPIMAIQVESAEWTIHYTARPHQKFWGKSVELTDSGPVRITFNKSGEMFEYLQPSTFLRNIIAGEKYLEPVGSVTVESSFGTSAVIEYKQGGMFSGRSEDLTVKAVDGSGKAYPVSFEGKWTNEIWSMGSDGKKFIWKAGNLVPRSQSKYGFTEWAASLNEVTSIENDSIAPTDSRLRPDQRLYEDGDIDGAEIHKIRLEEGQRKRRHQMEELGKVWTPNFFEKSNDPAGFYVLKSGQDNYWIRREAQDWKGLTQLW
jgi:hypothetical protein